MSATRQPTLPLLAINIQTQNRNYPKFSSPIQIDDSPMPIGQLQGRKISEVSPWATNSPISGKKRSFAMPLKISPKTQFMQLNPTERGRSDGNDVIDGLGQESIANNSQYKNPFGYLKKVGSKSGSQTYTPDDNTSEDSGVQPGVELVGGLVKELQNTENVIGSPYSGIVPQIGGTEETPYHSAGYGRKMLHKPSKSNILKKIHLLPHYPSNNKRSSSNKLSDEAIQQLGTLTGKRMTNMTVDTQMQLMNEMYAASHNLIGQRKESAMKLTQREEQAGPIFRNKMLQKVQQEQVQQQQVDDYFTQNSRDTSEVNQVRRRLQDIKRRYFSNSQQREEDMDRVGTVERIKRKLTSLQNAPKLQPSSQYFNQTQLDDYGSRKIVGYADGDSYPTIQAQVAHKNSSVALMNQNESQLSFMPPPPVYTKQDSIPTTHRHFHNKQAVLKLNSQLIDTPSFAQKGDKPFILQPIKDDIKVLKSSLAGPSSIMSGGSSLERLNPQPSIFSGRESLRDINKSTMLGSYPSQMNSKAYLKSERIMEPTQLFRPVQFVNSNVRPLDHPLKNIQRMVDRQKAQTTLKKDFQAISSLSIQKQSKILTIVPSQSPINIDESGKKKFTMPKLQLLSPNAVNTFTSPIGSVNSTPQAALQPTLNYFQKRGLANMSTGLDDTITPPILLVKQHVIHHAGTKQNSPKKVSSPFAKHIRSQSQALGSNDINYLQQQTSLDGETMMQQMIQHVDSLTEYPNNTVRSNHIAQSITHVDVAIKNKGGYN